MLELYKRNSDSGILISINPVGEVKCGTPCLNNSKYNMNEIIINGVDTVVGNIITYALGLYSEKASKVAFPWFF